MNLLWEFQEMNPKDPSTWYKDQLRDHAMKELNNSGMVEIYNHQYLWDNRQYPRIYDAFVDIWDNEKLWVTIDRANLNPPNRSQRPFSRLYSLGRRHHARSPAGKCAGRALASRPRTRHGWFSGRT